MQVHLIRPYELGPAEIAAWHSMQRATPSLANPFLSPEFALAVGQDRPNAQVAVLTEGSAIVGFFPFERRRFGLGVPMGGWLSHYQGLVHAPGAEWDPAELLQGCRLAAWQFDNLIAGQQSFKPYHAVTGSAPMIDLTDGFDAYDAAIRAKSPRHSRELARKTRKLGREVGEVRTVADSRDINLLYMLIAWKSEQYRRTGCVDNFGQPWVVGLLEALHATRSCHAGGLLSVMYAGDHPVAAQFGLRTGNLLAGWYTAYDPRFAKYSPGLIHLRQMTEQLAAAGIHTISMGKGALKYTKVLRNHEVSLAEGVVTGRSALGTLHRVRGASTRWAIRSIRQRPGVHQAADRALRRSGLSRRVYGRL